MEDSNKLHCQCGDDNPKTSKKLIECIICKDLSHLTCHKFTITGVHARKRLLFVDFVIKTGICQLLSKLLTYSDKNDVVLNKLREKMIEKSVKIKKKTWHLWPHIIHYVRY